MSTKIRNLFWVIVGFAVGVVLASSAVKAATILAGYQGGTSFGPTTSASNVGKFLRVSSSSPYLTYDFASALTATPTLQQVTDVGAITTNALTFAGGTSTAGLVVQGVLRAPTGSFTYTDATTTNATFAAIGTLTGSNATITNVSSTNMSVSSSLLVAGKAVCLADGTNCLATSTPTLQQVATAGNTTLLALQYAGGTSTAAFAVQGLLTATTASTTGNASVGGAFGLTGAATLGSTLAVTGVSSLATTSITALSVTGNTTGTTAYYTGLTVAGTSDLQGAVFIGTSGATVNGGVTAVGVTTTNLFATSATITSITSTNHNSTNYTGTNATLTSVTSTNLFATTGTFTNLVVTAAITGGSLAISGNATIGGTLGVTGVSTLATTTVTNFTASRTSTLATTTITSLSVNGVSYPSAAGSAGQIFRSNGTNFALSTSIWPDTTTANQILYSSSANTIAGITTANNGVLVTTGSGVPVVSSTLPTAVQGNITSVGTLTGLTVSGLTSLASTTITGNATTTGNQVVGGTLSVTGASTLTGNVTAAGTLTVTSSVTNTLKLATNGFTKLGELAPSIKYAYVTGTLPSAGGENSYSFPTGVDVANVIGISAMAVAPGLSSSAFANNTCAGALIGDVFCYQIYNYNGTIYVDVSSSGTSIAGGNFIIIIQYSDTPLVVQN